MRGLVLRLNSLLVNLIPLLSKSAIHITEGSIQIRLLGLLLRLNGLFLYLLAVLRGFFLLRGLLLTIVAGVSLSVESLFDASELRLVLGHAVRGAH